MLAGYPFSEPAIERGVMRCHATSRPAITANDVPVSPYFFKFGKQYVYTSHRTLDLGSYRVGRPEKSIKDATPVTLNITGMKAFASC